MDGSMNPIVYRRRKRPNGVDRAIVEFNFLQSNRIAIRSDDEYRSPLTSVNDNGQVRLNSIGRNELATDDFENVNRPVHQQPLGDPDED